MVQTDISDAYVLKAFSESENGDMRIIGQHWDALFYAGYIENVEIGDHKYSWWSGNDNGADVIYLRGGMIPVSNAHKYVWIQGKFIMLKIVDGKIYDMRYINKTNL